LDFWTKINGIKDICSESSAGAAGKNLTRAQQKARGRGYINGSKGICSESSDPK